MNDMLQFDRAQEAGSRRGREAEAWARERALARAAKSVRVASSAPAATSARVARWLDMVRELLGQRRPASPPQPLSEQRPNAAGR